MTAAVYFWFDRLDSFGVFTFPCRVRNGRGFMYLPDTVGCASLLKVFVCFLGIEVLLAFSDTTFFLRESLGRATAPSRTLL